LSYDFGMAVIARKTGTKQNHIPFDGASVAKSRECFSLHFQKVNDYWGYIGSTLNEIIQRSRKNNKQLALYGSGHFCESLFEKTALAPDHVALVIDDNSSKWGHRTHQNLPIAGPEELLHSTIDTVILATDTFEKGMKKNLDRLAEKHHRKYDVIALNSTAIAYLDDSAN
jgi:hypothetical protein